MRALVTVFWRCSLSVSGGVRGAVMLASDPPTYKGGRMRRTLFLSLSAAAALAVAAAPAATAASTASAADPAPCGTVTTAPTYTHVIWILMENHSFGDIIGNTA